MATIENLATLAGRIEATRKKRGLSCYAVDKLADLSFGHTASIEAGRRYRPNVDTVSKIAAVLEIDLGWLINGSFQE